MKTEVRKPASTPLLWVDMNVREGSPSMQNLLRSRQAFEDAGFEIHTICSECDPALAGRVYGRIARVPVRSVDSITFSLLANLGFCLNPTWRRFPGIVHSTGGNVIGADVISIHFLPDDWCCKMLGAKGKGWKEWAVAPLFGVAAALEWAQRAFNRKSCYHVVSRALAESLRRKGVDSARIVVIPTPYSPERFNIAVRKRHRTGAREEFGFSRGQKVFAFVSQGAYFRKGLRTAVEAVRGLRRRGRDAVLFIIGGRGASWAAMKARLEAAHADHGEWLKIAGFVPDLAAALSASDAFLFPSLYEGFAAVEVEAAALGLPLFLTKHPGSEMILQEGRNGWWISEDPEEAAARIHDVYDSIDVVDPPIVGEALVQEEWGRAVLRLYENVRMEMDRRGALEGPPAKAP